MIPPSFVTSVNNHAGLLDGRILGKDIVEEPHEDISLEQLSPPHSPILGASPSPSTNRPDHPSRPPPRRSSSFRPKRNSSRQIPAPNQERDVEALAHIWWKYAREADTFDDRRISHLHKTLDVILLFSAIFSAIITPFIAESYKLLGGQPSPGFFDADGFPVRVNAMWFGSLILSLIAALVSIHCKMWLDGYGVDLAFTGATTKGLIGACRLRQYRYQGQQTYCISGMIGVPPMILYVSLGSFAIGLIDFLWHLDPGIAIYVLVLCGLALIFHVVTTSIPCFTTRSPFKTPLSHLVGNLWRGIRQRRPPMGLMEEEEWDDIEMLGENLEANSLRWLMEHTQSEEVYEEAFRAEREFFRQQSQLES